MWAEQLNSSKSMLDAELMTERAARAEEAELLAIERRAVDALQKQASQLEARLEEELEEERRKVAALQDVLDSTEADASLASERLSDALERGEAEMHAASVRVSEALESAENEKRSAAERLERELRRALELVDQTRRLVEGDATADTETELPDDMPAELCALRDALAAVAAVATTRIDGKDGELQAAHLKLQQDWASSSQTLKAVMAHLEEAQEMEAAQACI